MESDDLSYKIIGCAIDIHKELGPGLLESTYEACMAYELIQNGLYVERQLALPVIYKNVKLDVGYRIDILVNDTIIIDVKSVKKTEPIHEAQLITYLKLSGKKIGLLINFNSLVLKNGIFRFAN